MAIKGDEDCPLPSVGDEFVAMEVFYEGYTWFELDGFSKEVLFNPSYFSILPDVTADEIEDAEKEAIVPAPCLYGNEHLHPIFKNILNSFITH